MRETRERPRRPSVHVAADPRTAVAWALVGLVVVSQIVYPLVGGESRRLLTIATVCLGFTAATVHAALTRGAAAALALVLVTAGGGLLVEAAGTATGWPFGAYAYAGSLGPSVFEVPWVIPLAWTMMAWPAWLVGGWLARGRLPARIAVAGWALASWDVFLDPQMVDAGHWAWTGGGAALPGVPRIPLTNYAGWLLVALAMMALLAGVLAGVVPARPPARATGRCWRSTSGPTPPRCSPTRCSSACRRRPPGGRWRWAWSRCRSR